MQVSQIKASPRERGRHSCADWTTDQQLGKERTTEVLSL